MLGKLVTLLVGTALLFVIAAQAADPSATVTTDAAKSCKDQATRDYETNVQSCKRNLSDLPDQLAQCINDFAADRDRTIADCDTSQKAGEQ